VPTFSKKPVWVGPGETVVSVKFMRASEFD